MDIISIAAKTFTPLGKAAWAFLTSVAIAYWIAAPAGLHTIALAALAMFVIDTLSGSVLACKDRQFRRFGRAISKLIVYGFAIAASIPLGNVLALSYAVTTMVAMLIFLRESTSVLENLRDLGFPLPAWVSDRLHELEEACDADPASKTVTESTETCVTQPTEDGGEHTVCDTVATTTQTKGE